MILPPKNNQIELRYFVKLLDNILRCEDVSINHKKLTVVLPVVLDYFVGKSEALLCQTLCNGAKCTGTFNRSNLSHPEFRERAKTQ